jgi:hypothetical protein
MRKGLVEGAEEIGNGLMSDEGCGCLFLLIFVVFPCVSGTLGPLFGPTPLWLADLVLLAMFRLPLVAIAAIWFVLRGVQFGTTGYVGEPIGHPIPLMLAAGLLGALYGAAERVWAWAVSSKQIASPTVSGPGAGGGSN